MTITLAVIGSFNKKFWRFADSLYGWFWLKNYKNNL